MRLLMRRPAHGPNILWRWVTTRDHHTHSDAVREIRGVYGNETKYTTCESGLLEIHSWSNRAGANYCIVNEWMYKFIELMLYRNMFVIVKPSVWIWINFRRYIVSHLWRRCEQEREYAQEVNDYWWQMTKNDFLTERIKNKRSHRSKTHIE